MIQLYRKRNGMERLSLEIKDLHTLFTETDSHLEALRKLVGPRLENIFYTVNDSGTGDRAFSKCTHLAFDIDHADSAQWEAYLEAANEVCATTRANWTVVSSGHGLHLLLPLTPNQHWTDKALFPRKRLQYRALCQKLQVRMGALPGKVDSSIFDAARVLRMPGTLNLKPDQPEAACLTLHLGLEAFDLDLATLSGISVQTGTAVTPDVVGDRTSVAWQGDNDEAFILENCEAIKCASSGKHDEPMWYALDSILGRFSNGRELIHKWSSSHPSYSPEKIDQKIDQALEASGPRTCEHIEGLWDGCKTCKFYKQVKSPIMLRGPDFAATASTGFHQISVSANGAVKRTPCYEDLVKFYAKQYPYISLKESRFSRAFKSTHYEVVFDNELEAFAQAHFKPYATTKLTQEFRNVIQRTEVKPVTWFKETTENKLNLLNGVLDLRTRILVPSSPKYGFRSVLPFKHDPDAKCPAFDKFLHDITCGDPELQKALVLFIAYALSGEKCVKHKVLILHGEGSNGKSTFLNIVRALFGAALCDLSPKDFAGSFGLVRLDGALACVIEEMPAYKNTDFWEQIKQFSSGGFVSAQEKYKPVYQFENRAKFFLTCNVLPGGTDASYGFYRRMLLIPFNAKFEGTTEVLGLGEKIIASELPGILNRVLEAHTELTKLDFNIPEPGASKVAMQNYMADHDEVMTWCNETIRIAEVGEAPMKVEKIPNQPAWFYVDKGLPTALVTELYLNYRAWCTARGIDHPKSNAVWGRRLNSILLVHKTVTHGVARRGGIPVRVFRGLFPLGFGSGTGDTA